MHEHPSLVRAAAGSIGLSAAELRDFRSRVLEGRALHVRLPGRFTAVSGLRAGRVFAVRDAVSARPAMGWRVRLADGATVYVVEHCGNLALTRVAAPDPVTVPTVVALAPAPLSAWDALVASSAMLRPVRVSALGDRPGDPVRSDGPGVLGSLPFVGPVFAAIADARAYSRMEADPRPQAVQNCGKVMNGFFTCKR